MLFSHYCKVDSAARTDRDGGFSLPFNLITLCSIPSLFGHFILTYSDLAHCLCHSLLAPLAYIHGVTSETVALENASSPGP